jgi:hypothetical protein
MHEDVRIIEEKLTSDWIPSEVIIHLDDIKKLFRD